MKIALPTETYTFGQYIPAIHINSGIFDSMLVRPFTIGQLHSIAKARAHTEFSFYDVVNLVRKNVKVTNNGNPVRLEDIEEMNFKLALINMIILTDSDYEWVFTGYCEQCAKAAKDEDKIQSKKLGRDVSKEESLFEKYKEKRSDYVFKYTDYSVSSIDTFSSEYTVTPEEIPDLQLSFSPVTINRRYEMEKIIKSRGIEEAQDRLTSIEYTFIHAQTSLDITVETFNHPYIKELADDMKITEEARNNSEFKRAVIDAMPRSFIDDYKSLFKMIDPSFDVVNIKCKMCGSEREFYPPSSLKELLSTL